VEFALEWALKDVDLALGTAGGADLPLLAAPSQHAAVDAGHSRKEISAARLALRQPSADERESDDQTQTWPSGAQAKRPGAQS
jgi:hypothetical protein